GTVTGPVGKQMEELVEPGQEGSEPRTDLECHPSGIRDPMQIRHGSPPAHTESRGHDWFPGTFHGPPSDSTRAKRRAASAARGRSAARRSGTLPSSALETDGEAPVPRVECTEETGRVT